MLILPFKHGSYTDNHRRLQSYEIFMILWSKLISKEDLRGRACQTAEM